MTTHISKGDTLILDEDIRKQAEAEGVEKFVVGAVIHDASASWWSRAARTMTFSQASKRFPLAE